MQVYFEQFSESIRIRINDSETEYKPTSYTTNFLSNLNPGWNHGYVEFKDFRDNYKGSINAYSVNFSNLNMTCQEVKEIENWAFLFDESKIDYLALIQKGLSKKEIKNRYFVNTYESINLNEADVANLIKIAANTLSNYSALKLIN